MVIVTIDGDNLVLTVKGLGKVLALKSELVIPLQHISGVAADTNVTKPEGWRGPGSNIPGFLYAGTFHHHGDKVFWDVHDPTHAIVIELANEEFSRLVVEVSDPAEVISLIEQRIS